MFTHTFQIHTGELQSILWLVGSVCIKDSHRQYIIAPTKLFIRRMSSVLTINVDRSSYPQMPEGPITQIERHDIPNTIPMIAFAAL